MWEEEIYSKGQQLNRYPYDCVVTFVMRNAPRDRPRSEVRIVELGCGAGNNLWFAALEGFQVAGIDGSESTIAAARKRFAEDHLAGELVVGDYSGGLPFASDWADLAIDRAALSCSGYAAAAAAVSEIRRVLRTGGRMFFNPYSSFHSSAVAGERGPDGVILNITAGNACWSWANMFLFGR